MRNLMNYSITVRVQNALNSHASICNINNFRGFYPEHPMKRGREGECGGFGREEEGTGKEFVLCPGKKK